MTKKNIIVYMIQKKKYKYLSFIIAQSEEIETLNLLTQMINNSYYILVFILL